MLCPTILLLPLFTPIECQSSEMNGAEINELFNKCFESAKSGPREKGPLSAIQMYTQILRDANRVRTAAERKTYPSATEIRIHVRTAAEKKEYPIPQPSESTHAAPSPMEDQPILLQPHFSSLNAIIDEVATNLSITPSWRDCVDRPSHKHKRAPLQMSRKGMWVSRYKPY